MGDENNLTNFKDLEKELTDAKNELNLMNERIVRIVGRPRRLTKDLIRNDKHSEQRSNEKVNYNKNSDTKSIQNRLNPSATTANYEDQKPKLTSRIVRELPSRKDIVAAQCADSESHARNRRIFGSLLGTLQKFNLEESRLKQKEDKKAQIERKVEKQTLLEHEFIKRERDELFLNRKRKQLEIKQLEQKMNRLADFDVWINACNYHKMNIGTKTTPTIYFRPKIYSKRTLRLLSESEDRLNKEIKNKRLIMEDDFTALENSNKKELMNNNNDEPRERKNSNSGKSDSTHCNSSRKTLCTVRLNSTLSSPLIRFKDDTQ